MENAYPSKLMRNGIGGGAGRVDAGFPTVVVRATAIATHIVLGFSHGMRPERMGSDSRGPPCTPGAVASRADIPGRHKQRRMDDKINCNITGRGGTSKAVRKGRVLADPHRHVLAIDSLMSQGCCIVPGRAQETSIGTLVTLGRTE